jgi:hypothetical protein
MIRTIFVPVDMSASNKVAINYSIELAMLFRGADNISQNFPRR